MLQNFYSNGKLLLTGEYAVLDGGLSLALPTKYGQSLNISKIDKSVLLWKSVDSEGHIWFECEFDLKDFEKPLYISSSNKKHSPEKQSFSVPSQEGNTRKTLLKILLEAKKLNPDFLKSDTGFEIITQLTFPRDWGLGSSSTLINNIAQWAKIDAFKLLWNAFSGSGYDIACAQHKTPITYKVKDKNPAITRIKFNPNFKDNLYFVYLNKKQNSREGIDRYKNIEKDISKFLIDISEITEQIIACKSLNEFENLIDLHENLVSKIIGLPKVKDQFFSDYSGSIKSLGAWGGDFVLATGNKSTPSYFKAKGYPTILPYNVIIL